MRWRLLRPRWDSSYTATSPAEHTFSVTSGSSFPPLANISWYSLDWSAEDTDGLWDMYLASQVSHSSCNPNPRYLQAIDKPWDLHDTHWSQNWTASNYFFLLYSSSSQATSSTGMQLYRDVFKTWETRRARLWRHVFLDMFLIKKESTCTSFHVRNVLLSLH